MNYIDHAHDLTMEGFNPLPLKDNKAPKLPYGHPYLYEPITDIDRLFKLAEKIGIACGAVSDGFYCIDFDAHGGKNVTHIFEEFIEISYIKGMIAMGKLSCYSTAGNGYHIYFRAANEKAMPKRKFAKWEDNTTMIELIGHGGYVVVAPSTGYNHIGGVEYVKLTEIENDDIFYLFETAKSYCMVGTTKEKIENNVNREWGKWSNSTILGQYNNEAEEEAKDLLIAAGWQYIRTNNNNIEQWVRPGKEEKDGISATWGKQKNMFYVFSSSAEPFEVGAHSPFNILTKLKFNGDWKAAKLSLMPQEEVKEPNELLDFPVDTLPEFIESFINESYKAYKFSKDFMACAFIFTLSTIIGNKIKIRIKNSWIDSPIFWLVGVGNAGTMKTHPIKIMLKPLLKIDLENKDVYDEEMKEYNKILADKNAEAPTHPIFHQRVVNDATVEALIEVHAHNENGLGLYKDEMKGFYDSLNQYKGGKGADESFWLESFSNGSHIVNRKTSKKILSIKNIFVPMIGTIQPEPLKEIALKAKDSGFADRFLYTKPLTEINHFTLDEIDQRFYEEYNLFVRETVEHIESLDDNYILEMDQECKELLVKYQNHYQDLKMDDNVNPVMVNYYSKLVTYLGRFTLILCLADYYVNGEEMIIRPDHIKRARKITDYFAAASIDMFSSASESSEADKILKNSGVVKKTEKVRVLIENGIKDRNLIIQKTGVTKGYLSKLMKKFPFSEKVS